MRIITLKTIKDFYAKHPTAKTPLLSWYYLTKRSQWSNLNAIKQDFNSVDYVGNDRFVFNIKGNNYRLIAIIIFASKKVYIRFIGTHAEYDKINAKII